MFLLLWIIKLNLLPCGKIWNVDKKLASVNNIKQNGVGLV